MILNWQSLSLVILFIGIFSNRSTVAGRELVVLECQMRYVSFKGYTCYIKHAVLNDTDVEILVGRVHSAGKNDSSVETVILGEAEGSIMTYVPMELFDVFPNTKRLIIENVQLQKFIPFRNCDDLLSVEVPSNNLKALEEGTFTKCKSLTTVSIYLNQIERIEANVFHPDTQLQKLDLDRNVINAISRDFFKSLNKIGNLYVQENLCVNRTLSGITAENVQGVLPFFEKCFRNYDKRPNATVINHFFCDMSAEVGSEYTCTIRLANLREDEEDATKVKICRKHLEGKNDLDVRVLKFENSTLEYMPMEILDLFPNLESLFMDNVGLKTLHRFRNCSNLLQVIAMFNNLTILKEGTFDSCRNLKVLSLYKNQIERIEGNVFHPFGAIQSIRIQFNRVNVVSRQFLDTLNRSINELRLFGNVCITEDFELTSPGNITAIANPVLENCFRNFENPNEMICD